MRNKWVHLDNNEVLKSNWRFSMQSIDGLERIWKGINTERGGRYTCYLLMWYDSNLRLLKLIRTPRLSPSFLTEIVETKKWIYDNPECIDIMNEARVFYISMKLNMKRLFMFRESERIRIFIWTTWRGTAVMLTTLSSWLVSYYLFTRYL